MTELERQLAAALQALSAQFETEQRRHCAPVEALQQQVERLSAQVASSTEHYAALAVEMMRQQSRRRGPERDYGPRL